jgi:hypothetical protein
MTFNGTTMATTRCQHCDKRFRIDPNPSSVPCAPSEYEGQLKRCPACHKLFTVKLENRNTKAHAPLFLPTRIANAHWVDDVYAGTNRRRNSRQSTSTQAALPAPKPPSRPFPDKQLSEPKRERNEAASDNPALSFNAYMGESGAGIDHLQRAVGLPPLVTRVLKMISCIGRLLLSPIDYPMWRAVKQGKMNQWDRVAINLGIVYLLHSWNKSSRKHQDMRDQADYIAEAMKRKGL